MISSRNDVIRRHVNSSSSVLSSGNRFTLVRRTASRAADGTLVVTEHEEETAPGSASKLREEETQQSRSPIADMLYMRWLDGLKLRWPGTAA